MEMQTRLLRFLQEQHCIVDPATGKLRKRERSYRENERSITEARAWNAQNIETKEFISRVSIAIASNTI
jgi:hypothetical protein